MYLALWLPPLLNYELIVIDNISFGKNWVQFHYPNPGLIIARTVESRNYVSRNCPTKWSRLKD